MNKEQLAELDAVIAELKAHPERHRQGSWIWYEGEKPPVEVLPSLSCGSAFCIAGAVVARAGATKWVWQKAWDDDESAWTAQYVVWEGIQQSVAHFAASLLGIDTAEADDLFSAWNDMDEIERVRDQLASDYELDEE